MSQENGTSPINLTTLRVASQVRELLLQGVTLKNTFTAMEEVWLSLYTEDKKSPIVEQAVTKVRAQLIYKYAYHLIKYVNSIVGLDLVPLAQQDPSTRTWKTDSIILNLGSNKINDHKHLYVSALINLFGVSEDIIAIAFEPTVGNIRSYVKKTYDIDLGEPEDVSEEITIDDSEDALNDYINNPSVPYRLY